VEKGLKNPISSTPKGKEGESPYPPRLTKEKKGPEQESEKPSSPKWAYLRDKERGHGTASSGSPKLRKEGEVDTKPSSSLSTYKRKGGGRAPFRMFHFAGDRKGKERRGTLKQPIHLLLRMFE